MKEGKKRAIASKHYDRLIEDENASQKDAIDRAEQLDAIHGNISPHLKNPNTLIYKLVVELNKYLE